MDLYSIISTYVIQAVGWTIIHSIWQATFVGLILVMLLPMLQNCESQTKYHFAYGSLLLVFATSLSTFLYYLQKGSDVNISSAELRNPAFGKTYISTLDQSFTISTFFQNHLDLISGIWIIGMVFYSLKLGVSYSKIVLIKHKSFSSEDPKLIEQFSSLIQLFKIERKVNLRFSVNIAGPFVAGWLKPFIYFPFNLYCQLTEEQFEDILAHEISHIVRQDYLMNLIQVFIENLFYYHPMVWWIGSMIRKERELACDQLALQVSKSTKFRYAGSLLRLGELSLPNSPSLGLPIHGNKRDLLNRISNLLGVKQANNQMKQKVIISAFIIGIMAFILSFRGPLERPGKTKELHEFELVRLIDTTTENTKSEKYTKRIELKNGKIIHFETDDPALPLEKTNSNEIFREEISAENEIQLHQKLKLVIEKSQLDMGSEEIEDLIKNQGEWGNEYEINPGRVDFLFNTADNKYMFEFDGRNLSFHDTIWNAIFNQNRVYVKNELYNNIELLGYIKIDTKDQISILIDEIEGLKNEAIAIHIDSASQKIWTKEELQNLLQPILLRDQELITMNQIQKVKDGYSHQQLQILDTTLYVLKVHDFSVKDTIFKDLIIREMTKNDFITKTKTGIIIDGKSMGIHDIKINDQTYLKYKNLFDKI